MSIVRTFELNKGDETCNHERVYSQIKSVKFSNPVVVEVVGICEDCGIAYKYILDNMPIKDDYEFQHEKFDELVEKFKIKL